LKKCKTLDNYSIFVDKLQEYQKKGIKLVKSIKPVINYCIENNILKKYLLEHGSEVLDMIFGDGEYDRDIDIAVNRREAREEGLAEGMEKDLEITARNALARGISVQTVQEITGLSIEKITELK
jgi:hypothetical protein